MRADARARRALRAVPFAKPSLELIIKRAKDFPTCGGLSSLHAPNRCDTWQMCDTFAQNRRTFDERIVDTVGPRGVWPNSNYNIRATDYLAHWGDSSVHPLFVLVCQLDKRGDHFCRKFVLNPRTHALHIFRPFCRVARRSLLHLFPRRAPSAALLNLALRAEGFVDGIPLCFSLRGKRACRAYASSRGRRCRVRSQ
jgi:hypothetical protein